MAGHASLAAATVQGPDDAALAPFQLLAADGSYDPERIAALGLSPSLLLRMYRGMLLIRIMDERLLTLQRQGRLGFYGEARGQEAAVVGTAAALQDEDWIVPALREAGAAIYRGLPLEHYVAQLFGNENDLCKGRQMPCHPGSRAARYVTMSSCIGTQLPHATGMAMAARLRGDKAVVAGYLGDGATSEGDFHVALNFAGVFKAPVVFVCQNNQWAISTPVEQQSASPTMAHKALGYGIPALRVDGNDVLACHVAMRDACLRARHGLGPVFIEALTYRVGAHTSSDDPTRYRDERVTAVWKEQRDPIARYRAFLLSAGHLTETADAELAAAVETELRAIVARQEQAGPPPRRSLVEDVFAQVPRALAEQLAEIESLAPQQHHGQKH